MATEAAPVRYRYSKTTTYVDETGAPVSFVMVRAGLPVTVYYAQSGDEMIASKVVVRRQAAAPAVTREQTTVTTTEAPVQPRTTTTVEVEKADYQLKPMNCPGHILIYKAKMKSYRDLPVRLAELGTVYRYERSGVLHGLLRVRGFTQDDAHIFCMPSQIESEVQACIDFAFAVMKTFGFDKFEVELSDWDAAHPENYAGKPEDWQRATEALAATMTRMNVPFKKMEGEAAFYGPKIDVKLIDAIGRPWQLTTVQFDFNLPARFGLEYVGEDGARHEPLMVHRALFGSVERFFGILIEHYAGAFPLWLAPVQVAICPVSEKVAEYSKKVAEALKSQNIRVHLDDRNEKLPAKIRDAQLQKIPYMLVVGPKEAEAGTVSVRHRTKGDLGPKPLGEVLDALHKEIQAKSEP